MSSSRDGSTRTDRPTRRDRLWQWIFWLGHRSLRPYWRLTAPRVRGAFVALWHRERVLLVQNSYVEYRSLPGGGIHPGESPEHAAARECREEVGVTIEPAALELKLSLAHRWEGRRDRVWIFEARVPAQPPLLIDHREIVEARFVRAEVALAGPLFPPIRTYLERRSGSSSS